MASVGSLVPETIVFLASCARQKRLTTYKEVAQTVGTFHRVIPKILCEIREICLSNNWPALTSIVVNSSTGLPGEAFLDPWLPRSAPQGKRHAMWQSMVDEVYNFDWTPALSNKKFPQKHNETTTGKAVTHCSEEVLKEIEQLLQEYQVVVGLARREGRLKDSAANTYLLHVSNFVRWLKGDFEPGGRKN
ncbi:hypothetical protein SY88_06070 [Clostridiales bacterium PH28_bin88]|nr:hypothetical protein SY88_06070 [Clostridiales bacterium PH28_bin88]